MLRPSRTLLLLAPLARPRGGSSSRRPDRARAPGPWIEELRERLQEPIFELYHLTGDPYEARNAAADDPDVVASLKGLPGQEKARRDEARKKARPFAVQIELSEEDLETLRKPGYVDD